VNVEQKNSAWRYFMGKTYVRIDDRLLLASAKIWKVFEKRLKEQSMLI